MFAFGHLIGAWILGKAYEKLSKTFCQESSERSDRKILSDYAWFFLLFGALLPDIDFLLDWTLGTDLHRTFTHSLLFLVFVPVILLCVLSILKNLPNVASLFQQREELAFAMALGILSHFILDMILSNGIPLFWPNLLHFSFSHIIFFDPTTPSFLNSSYESLRDSLKRTIIDMALGTGWIFYLWWKKKVKF
ncbi:metal-dependent hydrolase [Candidatus Woesearchaeota archaeon]|nr:metal-dependent hydrolase [Candidatus Woesearchaeota archaeon]